jgi:hypothetical protein
MLYAIHLLDKPDSYELRLRVRPEHKAYLQTVADRIAFGGPLLAEDGQTMVGSLLVVDFDSRAAVDAWLKDEPFAKSGLYGATVITGFSNLWEQKVGFPPKA